VPDTVYVLNSPYNSWESDMCYIRQKIIYRIHVIMRCNIQGMVCDNKGITINLFWKQLTCYRRFSAENAPAS
jgi:hypothetical protein